MTDRADYLFCARTVENWHCRQCLTECVHRSSTRRKSELHRRGHLYVSSNFSSGNISSKRPSSRFTYVLFFTSARSPHLPLFPTLLLLRCTQKNNNTALSIYNSWLSRTGAWNTSPEKMWVYPPALPNFFYRSSTSLLLGTLSPHAKRSQYSPVESPG
jgi:hypothetical protein